MMSGGSVLMFVDLGWLFSEVDDAWNHHFVVYIVYENMDKLPAKVRGVRVQSMHVNAFITCSLWS